MYKVGDKIEVSRKKYVRSGVYEKLEELDPPFVLTITEGGRSGYYYVKENSFAWWKGNIEGIYIEPVPIYSRFEILDL